MSVLEIVLLIMGIVIFIGSFLIPEGKTRSGEDKMAIDENKIHDLVAKEVEEAQGKITDIVDETITYAMEKTERSMDRLTNEKMMAVNEYSDTVLSEINKNHQEVVFLYDMLNDKHENLKNTVTEVEKTAKEVRQTVKDAEINAKELTVKEAALKPVSAEMQTAMQEVPQQPEFELFGTSGEGYGGRTQKDFRKECRSCESKNTGGIGSRQGEHFKGTGDHRKRYGRERREGCSRRDSRKAGSEEAHRKVKDRG